MARIPKRLVGPVALTVATIYTVPALTKTIIRQIHLVNGTAGALTVTLSIGADAAGTRILGPAYSIPAQAAGVTGSVVDYGCYIVMDAGEILVSSVASAIVATITGDEIVPG